MQDVSFISVADSINRWFSCNMLKPYTVLDFEYRDMECSKRRLSLVQKALLQ